MQNKTDTMTIRIPIELKRAMAVQADKNTRSTCGQIIYYLKKGLMADGVKIDELGNVDASSKK